MADVTIACRDATQLNKLAQVLLKLAIDEAKSKGVNPLVVETYRSKERQHYLACQGRTVDQAIAMGVPKTTATKYCNAEAKKCTWTLNSIHIKRNAVDIVPQRNGKAIWNTNDEQTKIIIKTMQKYGFEAGANWTDSPDSPHFQIKGVSTYGTVYSPQNTNSYITKMIQNALNEKIDAELKVDGDWGAKTTIALNKWRKSVGYKELGVIGAIALSNLLA